MCGIIGRFNKNPIACGDFGTDILKQLAHRGPDGSGVYSDEYIQLGHARLAIIDVSNAGRQPMQSRDGLYVITFNGEIYNYRELRDELKTHGIEFFTQTDTEVLLSAYKFWGNSCVTRLRGMFAFAIWDRQTCSLFLARDRCGEKPLFYALTGDSFIFTSELKALLPLLDNTPKFNPAVVDMYLHYQFVPEPWTLLQGVHKLPAAHSMLITSDDFTAKPQRYWNVEDTISAVPVTDTQRSDLIREGLESAITYTLRADVPVGVALSGGIDSGAIATLAQKNYPQPMHAFTVGYPGRPSYDERVQARELADKLGMITHEVELPTNSFVDFFPTLVRIMDEPIADPAAFGHYAVPRAAADCGIKVLLSGIGGDEVFWGYPWVKQTVSTNIFLRGRGAWLAPLLAAAGNKNLHHALTDNRPNNQLHFFAAAPDFRDVFAIKHKVYGDAMHTLSTDNPYQPMDIGPRETKDIPAAIIRLLFDTWLVSNCLTLGDRVSMAVGVETRMPFLDAGLIELIMGLRKQSPDHRLDQKAWLRTALKGVLPDNIRMRPKAGFQPPVQEWLSSVVARYGSLLRGGFLMRDGIIDPTKIDFMLTDLPRQGWSGLFFTYKLIVLEVWQRTIVAGESL
jgi:asparagine synthase (glutamine-hydrolysing)